MSDCLGCVEQIQQLCLHLALGTPDVEDFDLKFNSHPGGNGVGMKGFASHTSRSLAVPSATYKKSKLGGAHKKRKVAESDGDASDHGGDCIYYIPRFVLTDFMLSFNSQVWYILTSRARPTDRPRYSSHIRSIKIGIALTFSA